VPANSFPSFRIKSRFRGFDQVDAILESGCATF
jgi:hypothetical protein